MRRVLVQVHFDVAGLFVIAEGTRVHLLERRDQLAFGRRLSLRLAATHFFLLLIFFSLSRLFQTLSNLNI